MDLGWATVLAAVLGLAGAALTGLAGVVIGGRISAAAAREAAKIAADAARESALAAREVADADREAARQDRFADRIRELAVNVTLTAEAALLGVQAEVRQRENGYMPTDVSVAFDPAWDRWVRELRLIGRRVEVRDAIDQLDVASGRVMSFAVQGRRGGVRRVPTSVDGWEEADRQCWDALDAFESAVLAELGAVNPTNERPPSGVTAKPAAANRPIAGAGSDGSASKGRWTS
jgi:hypothetical protein